MAAAKPMSVVMSVCQELSRIGSHHFTMLAAMADGAGRMNCGMSKPRQITSHTPKVPTMTSQGSQAWSRRLRRAAAASASIRFAASVPRPEPAEVVPESSGMGRLLHGS